MGGPQVLLSILVIYNIVCYMGEHVIFILSPFLIHAAYPKNTLGIFRKDYIYNFLKLFLNSKISCISRSFNKEISILSQIAKKLQARHHLQYCLEQSGMCKNMIFGTIVSINSTSFKLET